MRCTNGPWNVSTSPRLGAVSVIWTCNHGSREGERELGEGGGDGWQSIRIQRPWGCEIDVIECEE